MDRAEAIKIIEKMDIYCNAVETARDMAIAALREQEQSKWISVEEMLPESDKRVLVWLERTRSEYTKMDTDRLHFGKWVRWGKCVTHWMPLPEPPKEGADHE